MITASNTTPADAIPYLENDLAPSLSLDGEWEFRLADAPPILVEVPSAWETYTRDKTTDGPAFYRRTFIVPDSWSGRKIYLEAGAISFHAAIRLNGQTAGAHRGLWSPFQIDLTPYVHPGENVVEIEVWKPGNRFPPRESLAGFLPDVCTTFGGLWQSIGVRAFPTAAFHDLKIFTDASGRVDVRGRIAFFGEKRNGEIRLELRDKDERLLSRAVGQLNPDGESFRGQVAVPDPTRWEVGRHSPHYLLDLSLNVGEEILARIQRRIAFRDVAIADGKTLLNGHPLHLRGVLDWGWNPQRICPAPSAAEVRENFIKARSLGFNLFKLCLFVPDEATFDAADDEGMLLWLEMPMWLPHVTPEFKELALREYRDVFQSLHHHPSIALLSLGCELNAEADADFLRALHALAREWFPNALICDNSGSAEAYGGVLTDLSDFYDYHFYTDPHFFQPLVQHFSRAYHPEKPWIYGEFCDADTLRDFRLHFYRPTSVWWLTDKVALERDDFIYTLEHKRRLAAAHVIDSGASLTRIARQQATAIRKFIVEQVRANHATGGYVVTGWMDTPITSSGVVDDYGEMKFSPDEWQAFNTDCVLAIDRERRRRWIGGDRPAHKDPFTWWQDEKAEMHLLLSNGKSQIIHARVYWRLTDAHGAELGAGSQEIGGLAGGEVTELMTLSFPMPKSPEPKPVELLLSVTIADVTPRDLQEMMLETIVSFVRQPQPLAKEPLLARNTWRLWAAPRPRLPSVLAVDGPLLHRHDFAQIDREARIVNVIEAEPELPIVASDLTRSLLERVRRGRRALLWQMQPDARYNRPLPFWREAIHDFAPHPLWERVPHLGYADMRFFSVATDFAIDWPALAELLGPEARCTPLWRRFDARTMTWADYVIEVQYGAGRMFVTTLRFEGGLGAQPDTFDANPMGAWMLAALLNTLES